MRAVQRMRGASDVLVRRRRQAIALLATVDTDIVALMPGVLPGLRAPSRQLLSKRIATLMTELGT